VPAALQAALAATGKLGGGEHEQARHRVDVAGLTGVERGAVSGEDRSALRVVRREPARVRFVERTS
jgi:hypothetical protein